MLKRVGHAWSLLAVALFFLPIGCTALPDVTPFATSSREFASAVKAAGRAVSQDLRSDEALSEKADEFDAEWAKRNRAMEGITQHADGLVAIVKATQDARAQAKSLGDNLSTLAGMAGFVNPAAGAAADLVVRGSSFVFGQIALVRGAANLETAMTRAQPVIDAVCEKIIADSQNMDEIIASGASLRRNTITTEGGGKANDYLKRMESHRDQSRKNFWDAEKKISDAEAKLAAAAKADKQAAQDELDAASRELLQLKDVLIASDQLVATASAEYEPYRVAYARAVETGRSGQELIQAMRDGLARWAIAHRSVALALEERRPVSVESLTDAALEVRDLYKRFKELRDAK